MSPGRVRGIPTGKPLEKGRRIGNTGHGIVVVDQDEKRTDREPEEPLHDLRMLDLAGDFADIENGFVVCHGGRRRHGCHGLNLRLPWYVDSGSGALTWIKPIHQSAAGGFWARRRVVAGPILRAMNERPADLRIAAVAGTLRSCQLFSGLSAEDIATVAAFTVLRRLERDEYLFRQGAPSDGFYVVQRGAINVHRVSPAGKEQVIHVFRMGESLAEAALASPTGYPADGRALEPSTVLLIPKEPVLALIRRRPDLALRMLGSMSQHLRVLVGMLDDLTLKDVETRLANWLLKHAKGQSGPLQLPGTKRVLAAELGTSSETLSRTFAALRARKIISVTGRMLTVHDAAALQAILRRNLGEA